MKTTLKLKGNPDLGISKTLYQFNKAISRPLSCDYPFKLFLNFMSFVLFDRSPRVPVDPQHGAGEQPPLHLRLPDPHQQGPRHSYGVTYTIKDLIV
jgi:hypothetical protein